MSGKTEIKPKTAELYQEKPGGLFKKGNPGKPKGARHMTTLLRDAIQEDTGTGESYEVGIVKKLRSLALEGESWATKMVFEYIDGKPLQTILNESEEKSEIYKFFFNEEVQGSLKEYENKIKQAIKNATPIDVTAETVEANEEE